MSKKIPNTLPYELYYLPEELKVRASKELFENEESRVNGLKQLRAKLKEEPNLHFQNDDDFLLAFLRTKKFDVKRAFNMVKRFYAVKKRRRDLYDNIDFTSIIKGIDVNGLGMLPYRDAEGCVIFLLRPGYDWDPKELPINVGVQIMTAGLLHAILSPATQVAGIKVIFDFKGFSWRHLPHLSPSCLWMLAEAVSYSFPARFRAIHVVNEDHRIGYLWIIIRQFLSSKLRERVHFHGSNFASLHKNITPAILPEAYEGEMGPFDNTSWRNCIANSREYFFYSASFGYKK